MLTALLHRPLQLLACGLAALSLACASSAPEPVVSEPDEPALAAPATAWIVQGTDLAAVTRAVQEAGGKITHQLAIIRAVGAQLTDAQRAALEEHSDVTRIYQDRQVGIR